MELAPSSRACTSWKGELAGAERERELTGVWECTGDAATVVVCMRMGWRRGCARAEGRNEASDQESKGQVGEDGSSDAPGTKHGRRWATGRTTSERGWQSEAW